MKMPLIPRTILPVSTCGNLEPPQNGNIEISGNSFWDDATYSCDVGFVLVGEGVRTCEASGFWSGVEPFCTGSYKTSQDRAHIIYPLKSGHLTINRALRIVLRVYIRAVLVSHGTRCSSSLSLLFVLFLLLLSAVECPFLEPPQFGQVHFTSTSFGAVATYKCLPGFDLVGNRERTCEAFRQWSGTQPSCESKYL